jgi:hypothetical protein
MKIPAAAGVFAVAGSHRRPAPTPVLRTTFGAGEPLLRGRQLLCSNAAPARILEMPAVAGGREAGDAHIDTSLAAGGPQRMIWHVIAGQDENPAPALAVDLDDLHTSLHPTVCSDFHASDALQIHIVGVAVPAGTVTVFGPLDAVKPVSAFEPRIARSPPGFDPAKERVEGFVEPAQDGLLRRVRPHRSIRTCRSDISELGRLIVVADTGLAVRPRIPALPQRSVIQLAVRFHTCRQRQMLARSRAHPKRARLTSAPHPAGTRWSGGPSAR